MTRETYVSDAIEDSLKRDALDAFAKHEIASRTETSIVIRRRHEDGAWSSTYATEIVAGELGFLIITGDIPSVIFAVQGGSLRNRLSWIGSGESFGYLREKASRGLSDSSDKLTKQFAPECIADMRESVLSSIDPEECSMHRAEVTRVFESAVMNEESDIPELLEALQDYGVSDPWEFVGDLFTIDFRIFYAWAACRRALELLDAAEASPTASPEISS